LNPTKSIIEELTHFLPQKDKHTVVEARAQHIIAAAINLVSQIREAFTAEEAEELQRKLLVAIKSEDPRKFTNKIRQLKEATRNQNDKKPS
jgi:ribosome-associated toxin RatA of RatAB toxin-antitoxin module